MRRKDREVTDAAKIREIIPSCDRCRLGFNDDGEVYIVPLNFGYAEEDGTRFFYFHGAREGRKIDLIRKTGKAGFELDTHHEIVPGETACDHTALYQSVIGHGSICLLETIEDKKKAMQSIMLHNTGKDQWEIPDKALMAMSLIRLTVQELSCKEHL